MRQALCDQCGRSAPVGRWSNAPDCWLFVEQEFDSLYRDRDWVFCSPDCVSAFFLVQALPAPELLGD
jgi:hypothetical protein